MTRPPPPNHPDAIALGCTCRQPDNQAGAGRRVWLDGWLIIEHVIDKACPVHTPVGAWTAPAPMPTSEPSCLTWAKYAGPLDIHDFAPASQDRVARSLLRAWEMVK